MPNFPDITPSVAEIGASVYSGLGERAARCGGEIYPLHVGDTWMEPPVGCRVGDLRADEHPELHRYAPTRGLPRLLEAIVERDRARSGLPTERENVVVTAGATGGLTALAGALVAPGDEVLVLAPSWPLIYGIVRAFHGKAVPVPFFGVADGPEAAVEVVGRYRTARTVALYFSSPNNPTGLLIPPSWLQALAAWTVKEGLWLLADAVYEDYVYAGTHTDCRALAPERTATVYSFSKALGMAGNRCGYTVGPPALMKAVVKLGTHTIYSTPTVGQIAAERALGGPGPAWIRQAAAHYQELGTGAAQQLGVEPPAGGTFLFPDLAPHLDEGGLSRFLECCADRGLLLAPGPSFGPYPTHVRVCFTSARPEVVRRGIGVLAELMDRRAA